MRSKNTFTDAKILQHWHTFTAKLWTWLIRVQLYRQQFSKTLSEVDWMDGMTRQAALDKAQSMAAHIAYPSELLDDEKLTQFYSGVCIRASLPNIKLKDLFVNGWKR